MSETKQCFKRH